MTELASEGGGENRDEPPAEQPESEDHALDDEYRVDVSDSVDDAQLLVEYVSSQGRDFDQSHVQAVVNARRIVGTSRWTQEAENSFWVGYNALAASVKPVTVTSLKDNVAKYGRISLSSRLSMKLGWTVEPRRCSEAGKVVRRVRRFTLFTLYLLLITQIYWVVGNGIVDELDLTLHKTLDTAARESEDVAERALLDMNDLENELQEDLISEEANYKEAVDAQRKSPAASEEIKPARLRSPFKAPNSKRRKQVLPEAVDRLEAEFTRYRQAKKAQGDLAAKAKKDRGAVEDFERKLADNIGMVNRWNNWWKTPLTWMDQLFIPSADEDDEREQLERAAAKPATTEAVPSATAETERRPERREGPGTAFSKVTEGVIGEVARMQQQLRETTKTFEAVTGAKFALAGLSKYLLPLLYGLLGALAFVLRSLTAEVKNLTYSQAHNIRYALRLQLGALAGLAIGWFVEPEEMLSLSFWALAFVAGYSVEVLFAQLDKFIRAFSVDDA